MYPDFKILIVDDFALIRTMMKQSLMELGFSNLEEASDGVEAMTKIEAATSAGQAYSCVFLDWNMPRMTGLEVIQKCKSTPEYEAIPFVMISAERETESVVRALEAGALDFISKPFTPEALHSKLQKILLDEPEQRAANE